jgi:hypothetical protein
MTRSKMWIGGAALVAALVLGSPLAANATASVGACCFQSGACEDVSEFDCSEADGSFAGDGTSCGVIQCRGPAVGAPAMSLLGLVGALGALAGLAVHRLVLRK